MLKISHAALGAALLALGSLGCAESGPEIASVYGKVTMDGEPLPYAAVVFVPKEGRPAGARTDEDGNYELNFSGGRKGAMLGPNTVKISTRRDPTTTEDGNEVPASPETVPLKYNGKTELEYTVEDGKANEANWDLDSEGIVLATENEA